MSWRQHASCCYLKQTDMVGKQQTQAIIPVFHWHTQSSSDSHTAALKLQLTVNIGWQHHQLVISKNMSIISKQAKQKCAAILVSCFKNTLESPETSRQLFVCLFVKQVLNESCLAGDKHIIVCVLVFFFNSSNSPTCTLDYAYALPYF